MTYKELEIIGNKMQDMEPSTKSNLLKLFDAVTDLMAGSGKKDSCKCGEKSERTAPEMLADKVKKAEPKKNDYSTMKPVDLHKLCVSKGIKDAKQRKSVEYYVELLNALETKNEVQETKAKGTVQTPYDGKEPIELYKLCKERGLEVEQKKPAEFYIGLLLDDDKKSVPESSSESWDCDADDTDGMDEDWEL